MPKALERGILHIYNLVIYQDIPKNKYKLCTILLSGTDVTTDYRISVVILCNYQKPCAYQICRLFRYYNADFPDHLLSFNNMVPYKLINC